MQKEDLISRRAAIEALGEKPEGDDEWSFGCRSQWEWDTEILKTMPPAQQWIPVAERLPTENNSYLVWMPFTPEGHHITVAEWCGSYWNIKTPITAWMPLPTPWEGGQDGV